MWLKTDAVSWWHFTFNPVAVAEWTKCMGMVTPVIGSSLHLGSWQYDVINRLYVLKSRFSCKTIKYKRLLGWGKVLLYFLFCIIKIFSGDWMEIVQYKARCVFFSVSGKCRELYLDAEISKWLLCCLPARLLGASSSTGLQCGAILSSAYHSFTDTNLGAATERSKN